MPPIQSNDNVIRNHQVEQLPPPKSRQPEVVNPAVKTDDAGATTKRSDIAGYGLQRRDEIQNKYVDSSSLVGATVAGASGGRRIYTSSAEKYGFAPRTPESAQAARTIAGTVNREVAAGNLSTKYRKENPVVGVGIHQDGSISVSFSGGGNNTNKLYQKLTDQVNPNPSSSQSLRQQIQHDLNKTFEGNPNIRRAANGDVVWKFGQSETNLNLRPATQRGQNNVIERAQGSSNTCAAAKFYHSDETAKSNPVVAADEVWRPNSTERPNPHPDNIKINNRDGLSMTPCEKCQTNGTDITRGTFKPTGMTVGSTVKTGASGAAIAAAATTLEQVWNGKLDGKELLTNTGLGAATSVVGEGVERVASPLITKGTQSVVNKFASQALTTGESRLVSSTVGKLGGAGAAGGLISAGFEAYNQRANFADPNKRPEAIGAVVGQAAVGVAAGVAGAQVGAMIGTAIPIPGVGTVVGAAVGFGVGYALSATGADKAIASGAASLYRGAESAVKNVGSALSGAANKLASVFGW